MRPRVPANRRTKNTSTAALAAAAQQRAQNGESSSTNGSGMSLSAMSSKPIPPLPHDGPFTFEIIVFAYMTVALLLQYLHLYKSVWWLPHSYNSYAVNFYLIDPLLIVFSCVVLVRRVAWTMLRKCLTLTVPSVWLQSFVIVARSLTTLTVLTALLYMAYRIVQRHPIVNILYLAYPVSLYFLLFGLSGEPFLELTPDQTSGKGRIYRDKTGAYHCSTTTSYSGVCGTTPNNSPAEVVRQEVNVMKSDFNGRLKQVLFNSMVSTYYAAFVPCCFAQSSLHYDTAWVFRHGLLVLVGGSVLYVVQVFPSTYTHMMHRTAVKLGQWTKVEGRISYAFYSQWSPSTVWPSGSFVRHGKDLYKAEGVPSCAEPGNTSQSRFYSVFHEPTSILGGLLMVQSGLVLAQHLSLTWSSFWYQLISESLLLFANYYSLFKLLRDYLVFWRLSALDKGDKEN